MNYYWNIYKHETYEDLLNTICDCIYKREEIYEESYVLGYCKHRYPRKIVIGYEYKLKHHYDLVDFFKKFRHNENDGDYSKEYTEPVYEYKNGERFIWYYQEIPASFEQKPWIVTDSYGRIINSKDLKLDALNHKYDPNWKAKYIKQRIYPPPTSYRNGHWKKYHGDHDGAMPSYRKDILHNRERKEIYDEYGITFKVRGKRTSVLRAATDWDGGHRGRIQKGWKRTRKNKQWM